MEVKVICDSNNFILRVYMYDICICGRSSTGSCIDLHEEAEPHCMEIISGLYFIEIENYEVVDLFDSYGLPQYKIVNDEMLCINPEDYVVDNELWAKYLIKAKDQYNAGDVDTIPLNILKDLKIAELKTRCEADIYNGFYSLAYNNTEKFYSYDEKDQRNFNTNINIIQEDYQSTILWKAKNEDMCYEWTHAEFVSLFKDAYAALNTKRETLYSLRLDVLNATTKEAVMSITW